MVSECDHCDIYAKTSAPSSPYDHALFLVHTFSAPSTMSWTILSTRSYSGHISWHVPTGVMAWASEVGLSGSARTPLLIASFRSCSRFCLSCGHDGRPNVTMDVLVSVVVGRSTYRLIEIAHALLVGPAVLHGRVAPTLARWIRGFFCGVRDR